MRFVVLLACACGRIGFDATGDGGGGDAPLASCAASGVAVGRDHTCMIELDGDVACWGRNGGGESQPSADPMDFVLTPSRVALPARAVQVALGNGFSCARLETSDVYCWGDNVVGQLGNNTTTTTPSSAPTRVATTDVAIELAAGAHHACIRRQADNALVCWGANDQLQLSTISGGFTATPTVVAGTAGTKELGLGHKQNCLVDQNDIAMCWGRNESGQLGDPNYVVRATILPVNGLTTVKRVASGGRMSCAIGTNDTLYCWGRNIDGELGNGMQAIAPQPNPVAVATGVTDVQLATRGGCHLRANGSLSCWGDFMPGDGTDTRDEAPHEIMTNVQQVALGFRHNCVIAQDSQLRCWGGSNHMGELGRGVRSIVPAPSDVMSLTGVTKLGVSSLHACALIGLTELRCWGENNFGELGIGTRDGVRVPTVVATGLTQIAGFSVGGYHTCAWSSNAVKCWGYNQYAQATGSSTPLYQLSPVTVQGLSFPSQVSAYNFHTCAIDTGTVQCWGRNFAGQLGNGTTTDSPTLVSVSLPATPIRLSPGGYANHTCAILNNGSLHCWGNNAEAQLGDNSMTNRSMPVQIIASGVQDVVTGGSHTCALVAGAVRCWGRNDAGELGTGDATARLVPTPVNLPAGTVVAITGGSGGMCARMQTGELYCWGDNFLGQFGDGTFAGTATPRLVPQLANVDEIARDANGGCARFGDTVKCWGAIDLLGNGDNSDLLALPPTGCE